MHSGAARAALFARWVASLLAPWRWPAHPPAPRLPTLLCSRLLRDPALTDARYKSCLERMLGSAQKLSGLLHGQAVRVAEVNGLSADRSVIDIAWNWQM